MKMDPTNAPQPAATPATAAPRAASAYAGAAAAAGASQAPAQSDRVSLSPQAQALLNALAKADDTADTISIPSPERLVALRQAVLEGTLNMNPAQLAASILASSGGGSIE